MRAFPYTTHTHTTLYYTTLQYTTLHYTLVTEYREINGRRFRAKSITLSKSGDLNEVYEADSQRNLPPLSFLFPPRME